ncbi:hypothetical protein [Streptomyces melanogenes]|uniref:hypothetical protein n=1 Tax=Streptomyces melanogenes TaxID=67326 RepID=UPI00379C5279
MRQASGPIGALFTEADGWPVLARTLRQAVTGGWYAARLINAVRPQRSLADAEDPSVVLAWRIDRYLEQCADKTAHAHRTHPTRPLAALSDTQLHRMRERATARRTRAMDEAVAAEAAVASQPAPVTVDDLPHAAWPHRPYGAATLGALAGELARHRTDSALAHTRAQARAAAAAHAALHQEIALGRSMPWRMRAREDWQRERSPLAAHTAYQDAATTRAELTGNRLREEAARGALARADLIRARIDAELRLRTHLPDRHPHQVDDSGPLPHWLADTTVLAEPQLEASWRSQLLERRRVLATALTHRGLALAVSVPPGPGCWDRCPTTGTGCGPCGSTRPP